MSPPPRVCLVHALLTLCDDAFFAVVAAGRLDGDGLRALARRREPALHAVARGAPAEHAGQGEAWLARLCAAIAPVSPPRWMAMADVVEEGLSLEHGARGLRGLFTSRPSDREVARVRTLGAFAVRALAAVLGPTGGGGGAAGPVPAEPPRVGAGSGAQRVCLIASLGLQEEEQRALLAEAPAAVEALEVPKELSPKLARAALRGAFLAAMLEDDGARAEQAAITLGRRVGLPAEEVTAAHGEARRAVDAGRALGAVAVEAIRIVAHDEPEGGATLAGVAARLLLPASVRAEALAAAPAAPTRRYPLDRRQREAALGLAWAAALRGDPTAARRAELAARHDAVAKDLGDEEAGREARREIEAFVDEELRALVPLVP